MGEQNIDYGTAVLGWTPPGPTSGGFAVNDGTDLPKMRGRATFNLRAEVARMDEALSDLADTACTFWACDGPHYLRPMRTCRRCSALRTIVAVRETMARQLPTTHRGRSASGPRIDAAV